MSSTHPLPLILILKVILNEHTYLVVSLTCLTPSPLYPRGVCASAAGPWKECSGSLVVLS